MKVGNGKWMLQRSTGRPTRSTLFFSASTRASLPSLGEVPLTIRFVHGMVNTLDPMITGSLASPAKSPNKCSELLWYSCCL